MFLRLTLCLMLFISASTAQTNELIKDVINKNDIALRSVHKNMITGNSNKDEALFKAILKSQVYAVSILESDPQLALAYAYDVRKKCLSFLKDHVKGSYDYFILTDAEQSAIKQLTINKIDYAGMSQSDAESIAKADMNDPNLFNSFKTAIRQ